jgi:hypothetical protein
MEAEGDLEAEEPNLEIGRLRNDVLPSLQVKFSANTPRGRRSQIKYKVCIDDIWKSNEIHIIYLSINL